MERTKRMLQEALLALVHERDYDRITVQDVLDRAGVGRSTFYAHFRNKDHLLLGDFGSGGLGAGEGSLFPGPFHLFEHLAENYDLYRALKGTEALPAVMDRLRRSFLAAWRERLAKADGEGRVEGEVAAQFLAGATMAVIAWWLEAGLPLSPEQMNRRLDRLCASTLAAIERRS